MTSPNEWWKEEPYYYPTYEEMPERYAFNIPLIIEEVEKRGETTVYHDIASESIAGIYACRSCLAKQVRKKHLFCPHCGKKIIWEK